MRASKVAQFLTLLSIAVAASIALGSGASAAEWHILAYVEPNLPTGVIPQFAVELVEPTECHCGFTVKQGLFSNAFEVKIYPTSNSALKPSHILFRIRATGFSPYLLNTGLLKFDKYGWAIIEDLHFTPVVVELPLVVGSTKLLGGGSLERP